MAAAKIQITGPNGFKKTVSLNQARKIIQARAKMGAKTRKNANGTTTSNRGKAGGRFVFKTVNASKSKAGGASSG